MEVYLLVLRWTTNKFLIQQRSLLIGILILLKKVDILNKRVPWYFLTVTAFMKKIATNVSVWRLLDFSHNCHKFSMHNCDNCEIFTVVAMSSWNIATFVPGWLFKWNSIDLWSMAVLRYSCMWAANHIAWLNWSTANGLINPDYGRQFQATVEFRSGRFFNCMRCSALDPAQKRFGEIQESNLLFFVSWPERFHYSIQIKPYATDRCFFAKIFHFCSLKEKFTDIIMLFNEKKYIFMYRIVILLWYEYPDLTANSDITRSVRNWYKCRIE